ncbi:MAG TPA: FAD-binding oxidoreductase [Thermomicrobiales bacterium]|nr:FAD-binding oxidoreductase [Thermomicrobiales bacterium]
MAVQQIGANGRLTIDQVVIDTLAAQFRGVVLKPGDAGYEEARTVQNGLIDRHPAAVVQCTGAADVIAAVNIAREHDLLLSVKGGGHNVAGNAVNDGGIVIDLSLMRAVHVDPRTRTARVQGGATWAELDRETQVFGLAAPGGLVSTTGVAGLTLHGGMGHLRRKHGLSIDNLLSVDIVTADGQLCTASATEHPDLFWAVRGAGSNFGVVTSFEFRLHPVGPTVMLGATAYAMEDAPTVLRQWRDMLPSTPEELTPLSLFWSIPQGFPPELVGIPVVIVVGLYAGPVKEGETAVQWMRELATPVIDLSGPDQYAHVQSGFDAFFPKGDLYYWKSTYVEEISDEVLDHLCSLAAARPSPRTTMDIWPQMGAPMRVGAEETAFGRRPPYLVAFESSWSNPAENDANIAWARDACTSMSRFPSSGIYLNFPGMEGETEDLARRAYGANYDRLVEVKTTYDPGNLFRMNHNILPRR